MSYIYFGNVTALYVCTCESGVYGVPMKTEAHRIVLNMR